MAITILHPDHLERKQFVPAYYHQKIKALYHKLNALDDSRQQAAKIADLLHRASDLSDTFYDQRLVAVPC